MNPVETLQSSAKSACQWHIRDWERPIAIVETWSSLEELLAGLPENGTTPNRIVDLESPHGDTLSVGVAGPKDKDNPSLAECLACVQFANARRDPPYLTVVGDSSLTFENGGAIVFRYEGHWTEILRRNCVPVDVMLRIARHFFECGSLSQEFVWEEV